MKLDIKNRVYDSLAIFLILSLSFSKAIPNIVIGLMTIFYFILKKEQIVEKKQYFNFFSLLLFFLLLKKVFNHSITEEFKSFGRLIIIILLPILFSKISKHKIILGYIISILLAVIIASIKIGFFYSIHKLLPFSNDSEVNNLLFIERPYMGFVCLIGALLSFYMIKELPKYKIFFIFLVLIFIAFIFFIVARLSILTLVFLLIVYLLFFLKFSVLKKGIIISMSFLILAFLLLNYKNLSNRFFVKSNIESIIDYEPRLVIWPCAFEIINSENFNFFFGNVCNKSTEKQLIDCYKSSIDKTSKRDYFVEMQFNSHSQFISFFLEGGLIAFILFILFVVETIVKTKLNFYTFAILFSLILFFLIENVLFRQYGVYIAAILFSILDKIIVKEKNIN